MKRSYFEAFHEPARAEDGALGVVVVVCKEQLGWLRSMGCDNTHLYIYSKCGRGSRTIQRDLGPLQVRPSCCPLFPDRLTQDSLTWHVGLADTAMVPLIIRSAPASSTPPTPCGPP